VYHLLLLAVDLLLLHRIPSAAAALHRRRRPVLLVAAVCRPASIVRADVDCSARTIMLLLLLLLSVWRRALPRAPVAVVRRRRALRPIVTATELLQ